MSSRPLRDLVLGLAIAGMLTVGCTSTRSASRFDGSASDRLAVADDVAVIADVPPDFEVVGTVRARCTLIETFAGIDGDYLSDVDCSVERLTRAMRERASRVGGTLLAGLDCRSKRPRGNDPRHTPIRCGATVARPKNAQSWKSSDELRQASVIDPLDPALPSAEEGWRIQVELVRSESAPELPPRRRDLVSEFATLPANYVPLGDVTTTCSKDCSRDAAREGVREVAGRVGANAVVRVECAEHDAGWLCSGTAAVFLVDPETNPDAR